MTSSTKTSGFRQHNKFISLNLCNIRSRGASKQCAINAGVERDLNAPPRPPPRLLRSSQNASSAAGTSLRTAKYAPNTRQVLERTTDVSSAGGHFHTRKSTTLPTCEFVRALDIRYAGASKKLAGSDFQEQPLSSRSFASPETLLSAEFPVKSTRADGGCVPLLFKICSFLSLEMGSSSSRPRM